MATFELRLWELFCYCFMFVVGLLGNLIVILVVLKNGPNFRRFRQVPFNVYLTSLAVFDLALAVVCLPIYIMSTAKFSHPAGIRGDVFCKIITGYLLPFWLAGMSIYILVIISFERYTAVSKSFRAMARKTTKKTFLYIALAWLMGFLRQLPTIFGLHFNESNNTVGNYCSYKLANSSARISIYACVVTSQYVVPALIFIVNFYRIQKCLRHLDGNLRRNLGGARHRLKIVKSQKKTFRIIFAVSAAFFICWTPANIMYFLFQYGEMKEIVWNSDVYQAGIILGFFHSCINPFLYAFQSREFRSHCKKAFQEMLGGENSLQTRNVRSSSNLVLTRTVRDTAAVGDYPIDLEG